MTPRLAVAGLALALAVLVVWLVWGGEEPAPPPAITMEGRDASIALPRIEAAPEAAVAEPGRLELRPASIAMASLVGQTAETRLMVGNVGGQAVTVLAVKLTGDSTLAVDGGGCVRSLAPGDSCAVALRFTPAAPGDATAEVLLLADGKAPVIVPVHLSGSLPPTAPVDPLALAMGLLRQQRHAEQGTGTWGGDGDVVVTDLELLRQPAVYSGRRRLSQDDYGELVPVVGASLPVSLERVIPASSIITLTLQTSIDTQRCPAPVVATVDRHILGGHGSKILLPAYSTMIGQCVAMSKGQTRAGINFERVRRPDGAIAVIQEVAADMMGRSGLVGEVDDRMWEVTGQVVLTSLAAGVLAGSAAMVGVGTEVTTVGSAVTISEDPTSAGASAAAEQMIDQVSGVVSKVVEDALDTVPRVTVAKGTKITVIATRDIFLPEGVPENDGAILVPVIGRPAGQAVGGQPSGQPAQKPPGNKPQAAPSAGQAPG